MKILKDILGEKARLYHIYTDATPRYAGGSAGIEFFKGDIVLAIRQSTSIAVEGTPHFDFRFYNHLTPYLNCSVCKIGRISPERFGDDNLIKIETGTIRGILPNSDKNPFRGFEDSRLAIWGDNLYVYGTQFTDHYDVAQGIMCYRLDDTLMEAFENIEIPGAALLWGSKFSYRKKLDGYSRKENGFCIYSGLRRFVYFARKI